MEHRAGGGDAELGVVVDDVGQVVADVGEVAQAAVVSGKVVSAGARRRQRQAERRPHRLTPRFSDEELEAVSVAAALAGLTPTGYVAKVAVDVATARVRPVPTGVTDAIAELLVARYQVQKFSGLVNQAVAKWHSTDELPAQLLAAVALVGRVLPLPGGPQGSPRCHRRLFPSPGARRPWLPGTGRTCAA